jgi:hypothetical protein
MYKRELRTENIRLASCRPLSTAVSWLTGPGAASSGEWARRVVRGPSVGGTMGRDKVFGGAAGVVSATGVRVASLQCA